ncbi:type IV secretory system conjugative DNA transfer family protein [Ruegeria sp. MALMAid1280]|uniref:type IV secretory system conjugative DNA transfer family protein n=1 Tax=Ruegeria sp. MALMAid1280 TaxID=3411634 RepID=UPI003BA3A9F2
MLSETEARLMDADEVITLASPQHPIKASRIKYYDDLFFKDMLARQEGKPFPYPPSVQGVGPWGGDGGDETGADETFKPAERALVRDRSQRREARVMSVMAMEAGRGLPKPEMLEREADVLKEWETVFASRGDSIEELLGE